MVQGLGERLYQHRTLKNLSQKEVAYALGISPSIVSNYESGERTPSVENLMALASLYNCSVDYLLGISKETHQTIDVSMLTEKQRIYLEKFLIQLR